MSSGLHNKKREGNFLVVLLKTSVCFTASTCIEVLGTKYFYTSTACIELFCRPGFEREISLSS